MIKHESGKKTLLDLEFLLIFGFVLVMIIIYMVKIDANM